MDWVYPRKCALCGAIAAPAICGDCLAEMSPYQSGDSRLPNLLDWSCSLYAFEGRAAQAVKRLKYSRVTSLGEPMASLMTAYSQNCPEVDAVVPVPIHPSRRAYRGFNQSELLCKGFPLTLIRPELALRIRKTKPQAVLTAEERKTNLTGAFRAEGAVQGLRIMLIDDVITTGGTARACAEALKQAGAVEVGVLTFCGEKPTPPANTPVPDKLRVYAD